MKRLLPFMALCLSVAVWGCEMGDNEQISAGTIVLPLSAQGGDGSVYRLEGDFLIAGELHSVNALDENNLITARFPAGVAEGIELLEGWSLKREEGGAWIPVEAVLLSPNPVSMTLQDGESAVVKFVFGLGGESLALAFDYEESKVGVKIDIDEVAGGLGLCPEGKYCVAGNGLFAVEMDEQAPPVWIPFAVSFGTFKMTMPWHYATGVMTVHFDLKNTPGLSAKQALFLERMAGDYGEDLHFENQGGREWKISGMRVHDNDHNFWSIHVAFPAITDALGYPSLTTSSGKLINADMNCDLGSMRMEQQDSPAPKTAFFVEP